MKVSSKIDWISATFPSSVTLSSLIPRYDDTRIEKIKSPIPVYSNAWLVEPYGMKILSGEERLGKHVIMSGTVLDSLRENEVSMLEIWDIIKGLNGKVSRIDIAVDVMDAIEITPETVKKWFNSGWCKTKLEGNKHIGESDKEQTFYIGKMNSKLQRFRVYDKAVEQGLIDKYWTRIELEKRKGANNTATAIFRDGTDMRSIVKNVVDFPQWQNWQEIFNVPLSPIPRFKREKKDYYDKLLWLLQSVPQAIVNAMILEYHDKFDTFTIDNSEVLNTFTKVLSAKLQEAQLKGELPISE